MDAKQLRIVFLGTPDFAVASLKALVEGGYNVVGVVTAPDKPAGRGLKLQESAVKRYAVEAGLEVLQPVRLKDPDFVEQFRALEADLAIVVAFRMMPEVIWAMPRLGTFNLHASLLPQYRGAAPINWAVINGEELTGVTTFFLNARIDEGAIIDRREVPIAPDENAGALHDRLMEIGATLVTESVDKIASGDYTLTSQDAIPADGLRSAPKIFRETCKIDFGKPGREIINLIRGLSPYPGAWAEMAAPGGESSPQTIKILSAAFIPQTDKAQREIGEVVSDGKSFLRIICPDGVIETDELQPAGKKKMKTDEFLRGCRNISDYQFR